MEITLHFHGIPIPLLLIIRVLIWSALPHLTSFNGVPNVPTLWSRVSEPDLPLAARTLVPWNVWYIIHMPFHLGLVRLDGDSP